MAAKLIDGEAVAAEMNKQTAEQVALAAKFTITVAELAAHFIGDVEGDPGYCPLGCTPWPTTACKPAACSRPASCRRWATGPQPR